MSATATDGQDDWPSSPYAVERTVSIDPNDQRPGSILLSHPTAPFIRGASINDEAAVRQAAYDYLLAATRTAELPVPQWWLDALDPAKDPHPAFGWLPIVDRDSPRRIGSVRVESGTDPRNRSLILLASERINLLASERINGFVLGSEFGLRVVIHDLPGRADGPWIRITGLSGSLPFGVYRHDGDRGRFEISIERLRSLRTFLRTARTQIATSLSLDESSTSYRAFRIAPLAEGSLHMELRGRGLSAWDGPADPFEFFAEVTIDRDSKQIDDIRARKVLLAACGLAPDARVFRCDPVSRAGPPLWRMRRPTRSEAELRLELEVEEQRVPLQEPGDVDVLQTWYVRGDNPPAGVKSVALPDLNIPVLSDDFTAVSAFRNVRDIFGRFNLYGLNANSYFQNAALPLRVHYRSGVRPGPGKDGQTVNGSVLPEGWSPYSRLIRDPSVLRPQLNVHLALADLTARARRPQPGKLARPAEPLGFADDPRWLWHEAAHVLLMATLGELEFRFAHSMGDALAAIVADPSSRLASDVRWRGWTFPWVFAARRHDRCVLHGWGWAGELGRAAREISDAERLRRKGYVTEQILSTSLFRMYRCIGGDTNEAGTKNPDKVMRRRASDYAVYLIMHALTMLASALIIPANAEKFEASLINADEGTVTIPVGTPAVPWVGHIANKAIRWAFEAQGMFAAPGNENAPGSPPPMDVFIEDGRTLEEEFPNATVPYDPGSYVPVSLDWAGLTGGAAGPPNPDWLATASAMPDPVGGRQQVIVRNRGNLPATGVVVRLWSRPWPVGTLPPVWDQTASWTLLDTSAPQTIPAGQGRPFAGLALPTVPGRYLLLAEADCPADPANISPSVGIPWSIKPVPLNILVPLDNNLGLIVRTIP